MFLDRYQWYRRFVGGVWAEIEVITEPNIRFWVKGKVRPGLVVRDEMWLGGLKGLRQPNTTVWHTNHSDEVLISWMEDLHTETRLHKHYLENYEQLHLIERELFFRGIKKQFLTLPFDCDTYNYYLNGDS